MTRILGIVNITRDSFSDGGRYLDPDRAIDHALRLVSDGADVIDIGAESSHPDAERVSEETEIARVSSTIRALKARDVCVSIDTYRPLVMRAALSLGADIVNDITGARDSETIKVVADSRARLILMHSTSGDAHAERLVTDPATIVERIMRFFERRLSALAAGGVHREQIILDPGLGYFIGSNAEASLAVLRGLDQLKTLGLPICVSASRKSFVGAVIGGSEEPRPVSERAAGTLAVELWAAQQGADYIRTHDVRALRDGLNVVEALTEVRSKKLEVRNAPSPHNPHS